MENSQKNKIPAASDITLHSRKELHVTGVIEVLTATSSLISIKSTLGGLFISGADLKIKNLTSNSQEVDISGEISEIKYNSKKNKLFDKVFR